MKKSKLTESVKKIIASNQDWKCKGCDELLPSSYQVDHKIPFSICQSDEKSNLVALCPNCHSKKTQPEIKRIISFKKLKEYSAYEICWYCLETYIDIHECNCILKDIDTIVKKHKTTINSFDEICEKFKYIPALIKDTDGKDFDHICSKMNNIVIESELDNELVIKICADYIYIDNYFTKLQDTTIPSDIAEAVRVATRSKKYSKKYSKVKIILGINEDNQEGSRNCADYLLEILPNLFPSKIFKNNEVEYTIEL